jgi:hypothetical protein
MAIGDRMLRWSEQTAGPSTSLPSVASLRMTSPNNLKLTFLLSTFSPTRFTSHPLFSHPLHSYPILSCRSAWFLI